MVFFFFWIQFLVRVVFSSSPYPFSLALHLLYVDGAVGCQYTQRISMFLLSCSSVPQRPQFVISFLICLSSFFFSFFLFFFFSFFLFFFFSFFLFFFFFFSFFLFFFFSFFLFFFFSSFLLFFFSSFLLFFFSSFLLSLF